MFGKPIQEIELAEIVSFLETGVREGVALEFKREFPQHLEKTLSAFANTYGGIVLIGVDETDTGAAVLPIAGVELRPGLRERVLQKGLEAIHPPLLPEVHVLEFKSDQSLPECDRALVLVNVAESAEAPHSIEQKTAVYFRGDNISKREDRKATVDEIEWLINKRQRSLNLKRQLISRAYSRAKTMRGIRRGRHTANRYWKDGEMHLTLAPTFPRLPLMAHREWLETCKESRVEMNSRPGFLPNGRLQLVSGGIFYDSEYSYSEYQSQGLIFHEFDYWWDYLNPNTSATRRQLYSNAVAALVASTLLNAKTVYRLADFSGNLEFSFKVSGLAGAFLGNPARMVYEYPSLTESDVEITRSFSFANLEENWLQLAKDCQRELYWAFGYDAPPEWLHQDFVGC